MRLRQVAQRHIVLVTTLFAFLAPSLFDLLTSWKVRPFGWVAADTFYYLTVARNIAQHGRIAFDREHTSNGFHPLWQGLTAIAALFADKALVLVVVLLGLAFLSAALIFLARATTRPEGSLPLLFPLLPVGVYAIVVCPLWIRCLPHLDLQNDMEGPMPVYGTLWSFANGMESCLVIFFVALAYWLYSRGGVLASRRGALVFGLVLSGIVLSRLDHGLIVLPLLIGFVIDGVSSPAQRPTRLIALGGFLAPICLYLLFNRVAVGTWIPTSGALKSTAPLFSNDIVADLKGQLQRPGVGLFLANGHRTAQTIVPAAFAILYLAVALVLRPARGGLQILLRSWVRPADTFLVQMACGVVLLAFYNAAYVPTGVIGHWYFPASCLFVSLALMSATTPVEKRIAVWLGKAGNRRIALRLWLTTTTSFVVAFFFFFHRQPRYHLEYARFYWVEAPAVVAHYKGDLPRFIEHDDGIVAWSLGAPTMSTSLGLDPEGVKALGQRKLMRLALERGYDRLTSLVYVKSNLSRKSSLTEVRDHAGKIVDLEDPAQYLCNLDYLSEGGRFAIVKCRGK